MPTTHPLEIALAPLGFCLRLVGIKVEDLNDTLLEGFFERFLNDFRLLGNDC